MKLHKYKVKITRREWKEREFIVEAHDTQSAKEAAYDKAELHDFSDASAVDKDYIMESVEKL